MDEFIISISELKEIKLEIHIVIFPWQLTQSNLYSRTLCKVQANGSKPIVGKSILFVYIQVHSVY